jgi:hypothetical protein
MHELPSTRTDAGTTSRTQSPRDGGVEFGLGFDVQGAAAAKQWLSTKAPWLTVGTVPLLAVGGCVPQLLHLPPLRRAERAQLRGGRGVTVASLSGSTHSSLSSIPALTERGGATVAGAHRFDLDGPLSTAQALATLASIVFGAWRSPLSSPSPCALPSQLRNKEGGCSGHCCWRESMARRGVSWTREARVGCGRAGEMWVRRFDYSTLPLTQ